jgi:hypothetical protein
MNHLKALCPVLALLVMSATAHAQSNGPTGRKPTFNLPPKAYGQSMRLFVCSQVEGNTMSKLILIFAVVAVALVIFAPKAAWVLTVVSLFGGSVLIAFAAPFICFALFVLAIVKFVKRFS